MGIKAVTLQGQALKEFQDSLAKECYGMTKEEALNKGICIQCREQAVPKCYSDAGRREYRISGLCEECFDSVTGDPDDDDVAF